MALLPTQAKVIDKTAGQQRNIRANISKALASSYCDSVPKPICDVGISFSQGSHRQFTQFYYRLLKLVKFLAHYDLLSLCATFTVVARIK